MYQLKRFFIPVVIVSSFLLGGCAHRGGTDSISSLQQMGATTDSKWKSLRRKKQLSKIRRMAIQDMALSIGAQSGLAWQAKSINAMLDKQSRELDRTFNFRALLLDHNVLPPVLTEGHNTLNLADNQTIRIADRTFEILKQARFATTAPDWREYLIQNYKKPERPHPSLLPKNLGEKKIWDEYVAVGWKQGRQQATDIYQDSLARLKQDMAGMILYRKLLAQNMVSPPYVAKTELGITGGGSKLNINDKVLRITALPSLEADSRNWKPRATVKEPLADPTLSATRGRGQRSGSTKKVFNQPRQTHQSIVIRMDQDT